MATWTATAETGAAPAKGRRNAPPVLVRQLRNGVEESAHRGDVVEVVNSVKKPKLYDPGMSDWNIPWEVWKAGNTAT